MTVLSEFEQLHVSGHSQNKLSAALAVSKLFPSTSSLLTGSIPSVPLLPEIAQALLKD